MTKLRNLKRCYSSELMPTDDIIKNLKRTWTPGQKRMPLLVGIEIEITPKNITGKETCEEIIIREIIE